MARDSAGPLAAALTRLRDLRPGLGTRDALLELVREQSPVHAGRSTGDAERLRGSALAALAGLGVPSAAEGIVVEGLQTAVTAFSTAAAARALRGVVPIPADAAALLVAALERVVDVDDVVRFDAVEPATEMPATTAVLEVLHALAWLGPKAAGVRDGLERIRGERGHTLPPEAALALEGAIRASRGPAPTATCCSALRSAFPARAAIEDIARVEVQDQDGAVDTLGSMLGGRPTALAFFYTRCMNPEKCSLTVVRLGLLRERLGAMGLAERYNVAALTYDPEFDSSARLLAYGTARGLRFDGRLKLLRTTGPFEPIRGALDLSVGYGPATVNQHGLDLVILDGRARVRLGTTRARWQEDDVVASLAAASHASEEASPVD